MTELKREYVVPLRKKIKTAPRWRRSKKAMSVLKDFIKKHMKTDNVVLCSELNEYIWANGAKNPPGKVSVIALKTQIAGTEKTLVNLLEVGIDTQLGLYENKQNLAETPAKEVIDAEVKESKSKTKEEKASEDKEVKTSEDKEEKTSKDKEVKTSKDKEVKETKK